MDMKKALKFLNEQIEQLEKATYMFDTVVRPRYERDREILIKLREQQLKMMAFQEKIARGESVTQDEVYDAIPVGFR